MAHKSNPRTHLGVFEVKVCLERDRVPPAVVKPKLPKPGTSGWQIASPQTSPQTSPQAHLPLAGPLGAMRAPDSICTLFYVQVKDTRIPRGLGLFKAPTTGLMGFGEPNKRPPDLCRRYNCMRNHSLSEEVDGGLAIVQASGKTRDCRLLTQNIANVQSDSFKAMVGVYHKPS